MNIHQLGEIARSPQVAWRGATSYERGVAFVIGAALGFGTLGTLSGLAYRAAMTPASFAAARYIVGALVLIALVWVPDRDQFRTARAPRRQRTLLYAATVANAVTNLALFAAYGSMSVALVMAVYFTYPLAVSGVSIALGRERLTAPRAFGLALSLVGLALVLGVGSGAAAMLSPTGIILALAASLSQAFYIVIGRAGWPDIPSDRAATIVLIGGALICTPVVLLAGEGGALVGWLVRPEALVPVLIAGVVGAAWAKVLLLRGVRRVGATRTAVLMLGEPLTGVVLAALFLGQSVTLAIAVGGGLVLAAAALVQRPAPAPGLALPEAIANLR